MDDIIEFSLPVKCPAMTQLIILGDMDKRLRITQNDNQRINAFGSYTTCGKDGCIESANPSTPIHLICSKENEEFRILADALVRVV